MVVCTADAVTARALPAAGCPARAARWLWAACEFPARPPLACEASRPPASAASPTDPIIARLLGRRVIMPPDYVRTRVPGGSRPVRTRPHFDHDAGARSAVAHPLTDRREDLVLDPWLFLEHRREGLLAHDEQPGGLLDGCRGSSAAPEDECDLTEMVARA